MSGLLLPKMTAQNNKDDDDYYYTNQVFQTPKQGKQHKQLPDVLDHTMGRTFHYLTDQAES